MSSPTDPYGRGMPRHSISYHLQGMLSVEVHGLQALLHIVAYRLLGSQETVNYRPTIHSRFTSTSSYLSTVCSLTFLLGLNRYSVRLLGSVTRFGRVSDT